MYSKYYQAKSLKHMTWFVFGTFRNEENVAFGRTLDKTNSLLEFFVAPAYEDKFLKIMNYLIDKGYIFELKEMENRLKD
jgi:hypothetical protein